MTTKDGTLKCDVDLGDPKANIHWYKENKEVYEGKHYQITYSGKTASLTIKGTCATDSGWYRCEAENKLGRVQTECTLTVECAPTLEYEPAMKETQLKAGNSLILLVNIMGAPTPKVTWYHGEEEIYQGSGVTIEGDGTFSRLTIKGVSSTNVGKYRILAKNKVGEASDDFSVKVIGKYKDLTSVKSSPALSFIGFWHFFNVNVIEKYKYMYLTLNVFTNITMH